MRHPKILIHFITLFLLVNLSTAGQKTPKPNKPPFNLANVPFTVEDPIMDGEATSNPEWAQATRLPDAFFFGNAWNSGFYYFESKLNWKAKSIQSGSKRKYPGTTLFVAHDIIGSSDPTNPLNQFQVDDVHDWNSFEFEVPGGKATIWVFDSEDDPDDSNWLPFSEGLANSRLIPEGADPNLIDDRGFIARLNDDPGTDVHWMEGMTEPGDPGWDWKAFHYVFGRHTFGQSFQDVMLDTDPDHAVDHEVYEFCCWRPKWKKKGNPPWCLWWDTTDMIVKKRVIVIKDGTPVQATLATKKKVPILRGHFWLHFWDPKEFPKGSPSVEQHYELIISRLEDLYYHLNKRESIYNAAAWLAYALNYLVHGHIADWYNSWKNYLGWLDYALAELHSGGTVSKEEAEVFNIIIQSLSLLGEYVLYQINKLELNSQTDTRILSEKEKDTVLASVYKYLYKYGLTLNKQANKGQNGNFFAPAKWTKKILTALK